MVEKGFSPQRREKRILALGAAAAVVGLYFFVVEPLHNKAEALEKTAETRLSQLDEMHKMAEVLRNVQNHQQPTAELWKGKIASERLEGKTRIMISQPLPHDVAKGLAGQLALQGKVTLRAIDNKTAEVSFWQK